jgi:transcriptional regulator with XRE-family HTH domain
VVTQAFVRRAREVSGTALSNVGGDIRHMHEDAGVTRAQLARTAGIDPSFLARIERGAASPSMETYARLALALGADLSLRLYPTTGPTIRDRHQAGIAEALLWRAHPRWQKFAEIAVRRPARGWIDVGLYDPREAVFVATEIQSELRRLEQLVRWSTEKAAALPSWDGWTHLGVAPTISRLLVVRETRATRSVASEFRRVLRASFPAHPDDALAALASETPWPGPAMLWAVRDRTQARAFRIVTRP